MTDPLKVVNDVLTVSQLLQVSMRLQQLASAAVAAGQTGVPVEELAASFAYDDQATAALRAAIERARAEGR